MVNVKSGGACRRSKAAGLVGGQKRRGMTVVKSGGGGAVCVAAAARRAPAPPDYEQTRIREERRPPPLLPTEKKTAAAFDRRRGWRPDRRSNPAVLPALLRLGSRAAKMPHGRAFPISSPSSLSDVRKALRSPGVPCGEDPREMPCGIWARAGGRDASGRAGVRVGRPSDVTITKSDH